MRTIDAFISRYPTVLISMIDVKIYLNVPYAQKDAAKALGARWDAGNKKWYVPADKDVALFSQWQPESAPSTTTQIKTAAVSAKPQASATGAFTYAADKNFIAYSGDTPPWD